jgi:hypothetical protein
MPRSKATPETKPQYDFTKRLSRVIIVTGGPGTELETLEDAAKFISLLRPFRQTRPHWEFAADLILRAAESGKRSDIKAATDQVSRALGVEHWL